MLQRVVVPVKYFVEAINNFHKTPCESFLFPCLISYSTLWKHSKQDGGGGHGWAGSSKGRSNQTASVTDGGGAAHTRTLLPVAAQRWPSPARCEINCDHAGPRLGTTARQGHERPGNDRQGRERRSVPVWTGTRVRQVDRRCRTPALRPSSRRIPA